MASNDSNRYRKTYSFFRAPPVNKDVTVVSGGFGINVTGTQNAIVISVDTTVITGSGGGGGGGGSITPIHKVLVVDPSSTGSNGAFSGGSAYSTLQAAYNSLGATATATIWCAPGDVGSLTIANGTNQHLTIRSFGSLDAGTYASIDLISFLSNNCTLDLIDILIPFTDGGTVISDDTGGNTSNANISMRNCEIDDNIDVPNGSLTTHDTSITGQNITIGGLTSYNTTLPTDITTSGNSVTWDAETEMRTFRAAGASGFASAMQIFRTDDTVDTGNIAPDSAHTYTDNIRVVVQPTSLSNNRIYKLSHGNGIPAGAVVDVWTQSFDVTITDDADATLITVDASSNPVRLSFFATAVGNFVLTNVQTLNA